MASTSSVSLMDSSMCSSKRLQNKHASPVKGSGQITARQLRFAEDTRANFKESRLGLCIQFTNGKRPGACSFSTGSSGLLAAPAWTVNRIHNLSTAGRIGPVIVPTGMVVGHKSSKAVDRMLAHTVGAVTGADRLRTKTKDGNSLQAVTSILPMS